MEYVQIPCYILLYTSIIYTVRGGTCWFSINRDGLCRNFNSMNTTREDCCATRIATMSWSPHNSPSAGSLFYWAILIRGAPRCSPCHTSCINIRCGVHRKCRIRHGRPKCVCVPNCSRGEKHSGAVCGSNGKPYRNECILKRHNCRFSSSIPIAYYGRCRRSCRNVTCLGGLFCLEDQNGMPHCARCVSDCSNVTTPSQALCGEDGVPYPSVCHLVQATCQKGSSIRIAYRTSCIENATCENLTCPENNSCLTDTRTGFPQCANCNNVCIMSQIDMPVCGTDGVTYRNYCIMQQLACSSGEVIKTRYSGTCNDHASLEIPT